MTDPTPAPREPVRLAEVEAERDRLRELLADARGERDELRTLYEDALSRYSAKATEADELADTLASLSAPVPPEPQLLAEERIAFETLRHALPDRIVAIIDRLAPPSSIDTSTEPQPEED